jgi:alpha-aminoadipic semialdehyde synthase
MENFVPKKALKNVPSFVSVSLEGHLFDTALINKILDLLQTKFAYYILI